VNLAGLTTALFVAVDIGNETLTGLIRVAQHVRFTMRSLYRDSQVISLDLIKTRRAGIRDMFASYCKLTALLARVSPGVDGHGALPFSERRLGQNH
jgi:hypothetical protein